LIWRSFARLAFVVSFDHTQRRDVRLLGERTMQIYGTSQVHGAQGVTGPHSTRSVAPSSAPQADATGDRLDISEAGQLAGRMSEIPDVRADRVQELRAAIASGVYESDAKLNTAVERLLDEIG
jgi:flagellar biosynthesis anti-sigma factor FlgM